MKINYFFTLYLSGNLKAGINTLYFLNVTNISKIRFYLILFFSLPLFSLNVERNKNVKKKNILVISMNVYSHTFKLKLWCR